MNKLIGWTWRIGIIVILVLGYNTAHAWWWQKPTQGEAVEMTIEDGMSFTQIASSLETEGIVKNARSFTLYGMMRKQTGNIHAGTVFVFPGDAYRDTLNALLTPQYADIAITIPEGYTIAQIGDVMTEKMAISSGDWEVASKGLEGYLFPDTYRFAKDATAQEIVDKMRGNFTIRMNEAGLDPTEKQIIIASIIEKEVRKVDEMVNVSDIIRKRLEMNMALQMDSTVNFITNAGRPSSTAKDLEIDSPYNTYKYPGLPPGPISNPGLNAIRAAMSPHANPYYYFLTDPEGRVYYAENFNQHVANRQYLD
jgi:UPF0755 protein